MNSLLLAVVESFKAKIQTEYSDNTNALKNLEIILKNKMQRLPPLAYYSVASTLNAIDIVHEKMNNDVKALEYFKEGLEISKKGLIINHLDLIDYHTNIGRIYDKQKQFNLALEQFELTLKIMKNYLREEIDRIYILNTYIVETKKKLC